MKQLEWIIDNQILGIKGLRTALDSKEHVAMIGIDLSKTFDCLLHDLLLSKLKAYGLSENCIKFLG